MPEYCPIEKVHIIEGGIMENWIASIGGYDSWQFAAIALGSTVFGMGLRVWKPYFLPIPAFGIVLLGLDMNHSVSLLPLDMGSTVLGLAGTLPFLFLAISAFVLFDPSIVGRVFFGVKKEEEKWKKH